MKRASFGILLSGAFGCGDLAGTEGNLFSVTGVVTGLVLTDQGAPVAGAAVTTRAELLERPTGLLLDSTTRWTDAGGAYEVRVGALNMRDQELALALHVEPPVGRRLAAADTAGLRIRIARRDPGRTQVNIILRSLPD